MNKIVIELCAEDRTRIDRLTGALAALQWQGRAAEPTQAPEQVESGAEIPPAPEKPAEAKKTAITAEDIRAKFMKLSGTDKKEQARNLIKLYADKISAIPVDKLEEVMDKLEQLEG